MKKFRFYCHVWTPENGHADKRYRMTGDTMQEALSALRDQLAERHPGSLVHARYYEEITGETDQPLYGARADAVRDALRAH